MIHLFILLISTAFVQAHHHLIRIQYRRLLIIIIIRRVTALKHTLIFLFVILDEAQPTAMITILFIADPALHSLEKFIIKVRVIVVAG